MKKYLLLFIWLLLPALAMRAELTIEECLEKAEANYPVIKKYELLAATTEIDLSDINKGWLPRIGVYGQGTFQNVVPSFPTALTGVLQQMGQEMRGLGKFQYKVGADVTQTVWDGGASRARRELSRTRSDAERAALDVELYAVRERVQNIYFAILLTEEQIAQSEITRNLLAENLTKLRSMLRNGVAMQSDVDMVEAQMLTVGQGITSAKSAADGYRKLLGLFIGDEVGAEPLKRPSAAMPSQLGSLRPELRLFDARLSSLNAAQKSP
ncbi:MAG: TolC family protein, partial [Duncaniella sp.]|nr:TolC family protein [Duncaniella sp.]